MTLADVTPERVDWLWPGRPPRGKIVTLDGNPGVGKSTLALNWAARVAASSPWPDSARPPIGDVLILSAEDGIADAIRPRIDATGGDPARVHVLTEVRESTQTGRGWPKDRAHPFHGQRSTDRRRRAGTAPAGQAGTTSAQCHSGASNAPSTAVRE